MRGSFEHPIKIKNKILLGVQLLLLISSTSNAEKVPSRDYIEDYNDPVLKEIFASYLPASSGDATTPLPPPSLTKFESPGFIKLPNQRNSDGGSDDLLLNSSNNNNKASSSLIPQLLETRENLEGKPAVIRSAKTNLLAGTDNYGAAGIDPNARPTYGSRYHLLESSSLSRGGGGGQAPETGGPPTFSQHGTNPQQQKTSTTASGALDPLGTGWTDLAAQGAQTFYTGVRQAGRFFGIDTGQYQAYEIPLLNDGARFLGR